jgi:hypothetical protein
LEVVVLRKIEGERIKTCGKRLVHEFWAYDIATDVAKETLEKLGIPFKVETERQLRDASAPEDCGRYDYWAKIYVEEKDLTAWLEGKIKEEIDSFGG